MTLEKIEKANCLSNLLPQQLMLQTATYYTRRNLILSHLGMAEPETKKPGEKLCCILSGVVTVWDRSQTETHMAPQIYFFSF